MVKLMKKERKYKNRFLIDLYLGHMLQKSTIIVFSISLIFILICSYLVTNPWLNKIDYIISPSDFHSLYMNQIVIIIQIFNCIITATLIINLTIQSASFDILYVSYISRRKLCICKLLSLILVLISLALIETIIIYFVGYLVYNKFYFNYEIIYSGIYILLSMLWNSLLSITLTTIIPIIFVPMAILLLNIIIIILANNIKTIGDGMSSIIPILNFSDNNNLIKMDNPLVIFTLILLLGFLYISIYEVKDLKN